MLVEVKGSDYHMEVSQGPFLRLSLCHGGGAFIRGSTVKVLCTHLARGVFPFPQAGVGGGGVVRDPQHPLLPQELQQLVVTTVPLCPLRLHPPLALEPALSQPHVPIFPPVEILEGLEQINSC